MNVSNLAGKIIDTPEGALRVLRTSVSSENCSEALNDAGDVTGIYAFGKPRITLEVEPVDPLAAATLIAEMNRKLEKKGNQ